MRVSITDANIFIDLLYMDCPKGMSIQDKTIIFYATRYKTMVLSGDLKLRKYCSNAGLEVHGILWLLDFLQSVLLRNDGTWASKWTGD